MRGTHDSGDRRRDDRGPSALGRAAILLAIAMAAHAAQAQTSGDAQTSPGAAPDATTSKAKLPSQSASRKDIDEEITNARLRAATGAKSLISMQSSFTYNGGSINTPLARERPQLSPGTVDVDPAKLTGNVSAKYRVTDHDNLNVGVGVGWVTPSYEGQRGQVENPYVEYGRVFKAGSIQNVFSVQAMKYTARRAVERQLLTWESSVSHTFLTQVGATRWQAGLALDWRHEFYAEGAKEPGSAQDLFSVYPFAEYEFNPTFAFRTVYRGLTYYNTTDRADVFTRDDPTQSMGIGITVARDLYLYPNIQWVWEDMRPEKTNVAMTAYINL